jgi:hypothetical protein
VTGGGGDALGRSEKKEGKKETETGKKGKGKERELKQETGKKCK